MKSAWLWRALEVTVWVAGLAMVVAYVGARSYGEIERRQAVASFPDLQEAVAVRPGERTEGDAQGALPAPAIPTQSNWSSARVRAYQASTAASVPAEGAPVALLRIRRVSLEVPVYTEISERNLNRGAALVPGSAAPDSNGNVSIAAHRDGYFRSLQQVEIGDVVDVQLPTGERSYRVTQLSIVEPTDLSPVQPTESAALTLVTCYPFYFVGSAPQRYIVRAEAMP